MVWVMTFRGEMIRVISLKRTTPTERKNYDQEKAKTTADVGVLGNAFARKV